MPRENATPFLSRDEILGAFQRLNEHLADAGVIGELCLFGGAAMMLVFNARLSTRDVDAVFKPANLIRQFAARVAEEQDLTHDWLNDGVKGFQAENPELTLDSVPQFSHLRIFRPSARYLLAMKCMASRVAGPETGGDREDIKLLIQHLQLRTTDEVLEIVTRFFPPSRILPKTEFTIHEIMAELNSTS